MKYNLKKVGIFDQKIIEVAITQLVDQLSFVQLSIFF